MLPDHDDLSTATEMTVHLDDNGKIGEIAQHSKVLDKLVGQSLGRIYIPLPAIVGPSYGRSQARVWIVGFY